MSRSPYLAHGVARRLRAGVAEITKPTARAQHSSVGGIANRRPVGSLLLKKSRKKKPPEHISATVSHDGARLTILGLRLQQSKNGSYGNVFVHARRVKFERKTAGTYCLWAWPVRPTFPCVIHITRIGPRKMDKNNAIETMQAVQDGVADWLGVDDGDETKVRWEYAQERGAYGVRIEIKAGTP